MKKLLILFFLFYGSVLHAQKEPFPFWNEVQRLKVIDSTAFPASNQILFIGSSSFTFWKDVGNYFPKHRIINRAFGGSQLVDLIRYRYDVIYPYQPKQIVMYCGENDFAANGNLKPREVFNRYKHFYAEIRRIFPKVPVAYISIKLSPSRESLWPKFIATNSLIKNFMDRKQNAEYIDITKAMNGSDGKVRKDLFLPDMLHMKSEGYQIWQKEMAPYLKKP